jgi:hypothetical protein
LSQGSGRAEPGEDMQVDGLVTALGQIELAARGFMITPRRPASRGALLPLLVRIADRD